MKPCDDIAIVIFVATKFHIVTVLERLHPTRGGGVVVRILDSQSRELGFEYLSTSL